MWKKVFGYSQFQKSIQPLSSLAGPSSLFSPQLSIISMVPLSSMSFLSFSFPPLLRSRWATNQLEQRQIPVSRSLSFMEPGHLFCLLSPGRHPCWFSKVHFYSKRFISTLYSPNTSYIPRETVLPSVKIHILSLRVWQIMMHDLPEKWEVQQIWY